MRQYALKAWVLKTGKSMLPFTIRRTRKQVWEYAEQNYYGTRENLKKRGYSVVKVEVMEIDNVTT